jgi:hypothetical protein
MSVTRRLAVGASIFAIGFLSFAQLRVVAQGGTSTSARNSSNTFSDVAWFHAPGHTQGTPVTGASSVMVRNLEGVWYSIDTSGLPAGSPVTTWWIVFNHLEFCSAGGCGGKDFPQNGGDPRVKASVYWATGTIADAHGQVHFAAHHTVGGVAPGEVLFGPGFTSRHAEIHLVVRSHGMASSDPAVLHAQLTTFGGGCTATNVCIDQQAARHAPPGHDDE